MAQASPKESANERSNPHFVGTRRALVIRMGWAWAFTSQVTWRGDMAWASRFVIPTAEVSRSS
jgi:hypothetical protein